MEKYLYFRVVTDLTGDDDAAASLILPTSAIKGFGPTTDTRLTIFFNPLKRVQADGQDGAVINSDAVTLTIGTNKHKEVAEELVRVMNSQQFENGFIVVADNVTGTTLNSDVTATESISIGADLT
jgi:hypothetical protein|tara:strand:- start:534 stop:908 length:375 start_codon:yes stop_codon:yes gene_type:complete